MRQVLFEIPLNSFNENLPNIPIHGYGFMLFLAFVCCTWLAARLAKRQGIKPELIQDLAIWLFISGIVGARVTYVLRNYEKFTSFWAMFAIWDGGLVFFGSAIGGLVGYLLAYRYLLKPNKVSAWKMADIVAPCIALGLCLGRIGCLLNGCCYGGVACPDCPGIQFTMPTLPRQKLVYEGYQTPAGFTTIDNRVQAVMPGSEAEDAGLKSGDIIMGVNGQEIRAGGALAAFFEFWPRGEEKLDLVVQRGGEEVNLPVFYPRTLRLHPTQIYETISTGLLTFLLLSYYPFRRRDGEMIVILMICYSIHRYTNEVIRMDTVPIFNGFTLSQNISMILFVCGIGLGIWLLRQPPQYQYDETEPNKEKPEPTPETGDKPKKQPAEEETTEPESALQD